MRTSDLLLLTASSPRRRAFVLSLAVLCLCFAACQKIQVPYGELEQPADAPEYTVEPQRS